MIKITIVCVLILSLFVTNCGSDNDDSTSEDVTLVLDSIEDTLFKMNPKLNLVDIDSLGEVVHGNSHYYTGKVNDQNVEFLLFQDQNEVNRYTGQVFNLTNTTTYTLIGKTSNLSDTIELKSITVAESQMRIKGVFGKNNKTFSGVWITKDGKVNFTLSEVSNTPVQKQLFIELGYLPGFYNTAQGLVRDTSNHAQFNDFICRNKNVTSYSEYSKVINELDQFINFLDDGFVYTFISNQTMISYGFKNSYMPVEVPGDTIFADSNDFEYYALTINYKWLENGQIKENHLVLKDDFKFRFWSFRDKFVIMRHEMGKESAALYGIYYWDNELKEYVMK